MFFFFRLSGQWTNDASAPAPPTTTGENTKARPLHLRLKLRL